MFQEQFLPAVSAQLATLLPVMDGACAGGMDADPPSDKCQKALVQLTALLFNLESDRLQYGCSIDVSAFGCSSTLAGDLPGEIAGLIAAGDRYSCNLALQCAAAANEGYALTQP